MHSAISQNLDAIAAICREFGVQRLEAVGSAARAFDFDPSSSDADFLVEFSSSTDLPALRQYSGFAEALESLLGRHVDLISGDVRNPYVRASIEQDRELVFAA